MGFHNIPNFPIFFDYENQLDFYAQLRRGNNARKN